jgi:hypothetical protein
MDFTTTQINAALLKAKAFSVEELVDLILTSPDLDPKVVPKNPDLDENITWV